MNNATEVSVSADIMEAFMRHVYERGIKDADVIEDADMWREVLRIINDATVEGLMQSHVPTLEDNFLRELRHGNEVFSAFKVHAMDKEMQRLLIDESGKLKPFSKWRDDVEKIASHQCGAWLRTEYDTAVIRAHNAADWKEYERDKDIMPNLRWMPTTSGEPEAKHRSYWLRRVNLPVDHPFWNEHHPGDRWNCKCTLEQNDDPIVLPPSDGSDSGATPHQGLENNPGKDGHIYNDTHPYFPKSCNECAAYRAGGLKNRLKLLFRNQKKDCYNCPYIDGCIEPSLISKYDKKKWEHTYIAPNGKGFIVTEKERIEEGRASKNEIAKFQKELHMCKVAANNKHRVEYLRGNNRPKGQTYDIRLDGMPTDLKSTDGFGNIVQYIGKAYKKQGAKAVLLEVAEKNDTLKEKLAEAKRKYSVRIFYYVKGQEVMQEFK